MNICWIDIETTGLDPEKCAPIEIALMIETFSEAGESITSRVHVFKMRPFVGAEIQDRALSCNGFTREEIMAFPSENSVLVKIIQTLRIYRGPLTLAGHNVDNFDIPFLKALFSRVLTNYEGMYNSLFLPCPIDTKCMAQTLKESGIVEQTNLDYLRRHFNIETGKSHTAKADVLACRELYSKITDLAFEGRA